MSVSNLGQIAAREGLSGACTYHVVQVAHKVIEGIRIAPEPGREFPRLGEGVKDLPGHFPASICCNTFRASLGSSSPPPRPPSPLPRPPFPLMGPPPPWTVPVFGSYGGGAGVTGSNGPCPGWSVYGSYSWSSLRAAPSARVGGRSGGSAKVTLCKGALAVVILARSLCRGWPAVRRVLGCQPRTAALGPWPPNCPVATLPKGHRPQRIRRCRLSQPRPARSAWRNKESQLPDVPSLKTHRGHQQVPLLSPDQRRLFPEPPHEH